MASHNPRKKEWATHRDQATERKRHGRYVT
jgi:hypothetical protein